MISMFSSMLQMALHIWQFEWIFSRKELLGFDHHQIDPNEMNFCDDDVLYEENTKLIIEISRRVLLTTAHCWVVLVIWDGKWKRAQILKEKSFPTVVITVAVQLQKWLFFLNVIESDWSLVEPVDERIEYLSKLISTSLNFLQNNFVFAEEIFSEQISIKSKCEVH